MSIHTESPPAQPSFSLPPLLQEIVAYATILSACAVIIYIIQLLVTKSQFNRQFNLNVSQFKLLNQGYAAIDMAVLALNPIGEENLPMAPGRSYSGLVFQGVITNVGNTPIVIYAESFTLSLAGEVLTPPVTDRVVKNVIYPKQAVSVTLSTYTWNSPPKNVHEIRDLQLTGSFSYIYNDFNEQHNKTINREFSILCSEVAISATYTSINDTV